MEYTKHEITFALKIVKSVCDEREVCNECPFYHNETMTCLIQKSEPHGWNIQDPETTWKALI